ncbi:MAG: inositol monophosphatase family protein [Mesorhizobium sp.]|nr:inositol monophosphatase family protein [Mesorhizobium sp.]
MRFDDAAIDWLDALLAGTAREIIMPRFRNLSAGDVKQKSSAADLVTEADVNAERAITAGLKARYPDAMIVGEEAATDDPSLLDGLGDAELAFVVDPIDGTFNFASGVPLFGVMLAVVVRGETVAGIIHDPVGRDSIVATKGAGSHIRHATGRLERVRVAPRAPISEMTGAVSWQYLAEPERSRLARNQVRTLSQFNYRCAAHEYRLVASGHAHFIVYNKLMPWDHLAGVLIHAEAGGHAARFDGSAYLPSHLGGGLVIAPDRESWAELRRELWAE